MIVITRNGQRTVITGWRAWLIAGPAVLLAALIVVLAVGFMFGIALTVMTIILLMAPIVIVLALIAYVFGPKR